MKTPPYPLSPCHIPAFITEDQVNWQGILSSFLWLLRRIIVFYVRKWTSRETFLTWGKVITLQIPTPIPWHVFLKSGSHASSPGQKVPFCAHYSSWVTQPTALPGVANRACAILPLPQGALTPQWTICKTHCVLFCGYLHTLKRFPGYDVHSHTAFWTRTNGNRIDAAEITE